MQTPEPEIPVVAPRKALSSRSETGVGGLDHRGDVVDAEVRAGDDEGAGGDQQEDEPVRVAVADAAVDEDAVVVGAGDAAVAEGAVLAARGFGEVAGAAGDGGVVVDVVVGVQRHVLGVGEGSDEAGVGGGREVKEDVG